ncbi:DUF2335 domain-containing protein [Companilactobacillus heilongjiangensis]|uniref:DUF2335 domain-containing protein n=1 Tax=Companilactobacillus heilongjiangensis TaxID=1074467 RepID=UPI000A74367C|nr:DUF2335 domain-containing protein [Companilactobacillus heilongjiangensis]
MTVNTNESLPNDDSQNQELKTTDEAKAKEDLDNVLKRIPKKERNEVRRIITSSTFSGPIPHPDILKGYAEVYPEAPKQIIENSIEESKHRRKFDDNALEAAVSENRIRLYLATLVCLTMIIGGVTLILCGHEVTGGILTGSTLVGVLSAYLAPFNKNRNSNDNNESEEKEIDK